MDLVTLLEMSAGHAPERVVISGPGGAVTAADLRQCARTTGNWLRAQSVGALVHLGENGPAAACALFAAAHSRIPYVPVNYRLPTAQVADLVARLPDPVVVAEPDRVDALRRSGFEHVVMSPDELHAAVRRYDVLGGPGPEPDDVAVLLHTSGTTAEPKAAVLRHRHLASYVMGGLEFASAGREEAALVAVPPYHVAAVATLLTNLWTGRRMVVLPAFDAAAWVAAARREAVTHALVVPTMLARIADELAASGAQAGGLPALRTLAFGGAATPLDLVERVQHLLPHVGLVNAYGLTETSSTVAVLGPEDHRAALVDRDPEARRRLGSVGRVLDGIDVEIRDATGAPVPAGTAGLVFVRGAQVAGEYRGADRPGDGWFCTRDLGHLDADGYLFVHGRADDTIIRGGENIAPAEIEEVLRRHPQVRDCAVVGVPDPEWGQRVAAAVVPAGSLDTGALREWARERLRSSRTPDEIVLCDHLPHTETGKLLRRRVLDDIVRSPAAPPARDPRGARAPSGS